MVERFEIALNRARGRLRGRIRKAVRRAAGQRRFESVSGEIPLAGRSCFPPAALHGIRERARESEFGVRRRRCALHWPCIGRRKRLGRPGGHSWMIPEWPQVVVSSESLWGRVRQPHRPWKQPTNLPRVLSLRALLFSSLKSAPTPRRFFFAVVYESCLAASSHHSCGEQWKSTGDYSTLIFPSAPRRGAGVAEQGCLLSSYTPKGCRGFESPPLRQIE